VKPLLVVLIIFVPIGLRASCPSGQAKDEAVLLQIEQTWAKVLEQPDAARWAAFWRPNGDLGYIRGLTTVLDPTRQVLARVRFTDIFVYRHGRWLAVAGEESPISDTK
jgi:hypothetical protein